MTQHGQNSNCFRSNAAMRREQGLMISCDTFLCRPQNLANPRSFDLASSHPRDRPGFLTENEPPGPPNRRLENTAPLLKASPFEQAPVKANKRE
jgi:hypothetical protein